jgi:hypothetical protein
MPKLTLAANMFASSLMVRTRIWRYGDGYDKLVNCEMLFDTGAAVTALDRNLALRAGYSLANAAPIKAVWRVGAGIRSAAGL